MSRVKKNCTHASKPSVFVKKTKTKELLKKKAIVTVTCIKRAKSAILIYDITKRCFPSIFREDESATPFNDTTGTRRS